MQHTPGPWIIEHQKPHLEDGYVGITHKSNVYGEAHEDLAIVVWQMDDDRRKGKRSLTCEANARLIAAAPELLAVLKDLKDYFAEWKEFDGSMPFADRVNAAIAKATGNQA